MKNNNIFLEVCKRTHPKYVEFRNRHYVENKGCHGQQIHFLIYYKNQIVGIISGASSVYAVKSRDDFFKIPKDKQLKEKYYLPSIINNVVFRLELHKKNLATQILSKWRKVVVELWENLYNIKVIGFETFVVETDTRKGCLYKADNWSYVGITQGSTKCHKGLTSKSTRKSVSKKLVYCKWIKNIPITPIKKYISCWRMETKTEKDRAKQLSNLKKNLLGVKF